MGIGHHLLQLELGLDEGPHIFGLGTALQEGQQAQQLLILVIIVPALDGDAVAQLEPEGLQGMPCSVARLWGLGVRARGLAGCPGECAIRGR